MISVAAFYRFVAIAEPETLRAALRERCRAHAICGTILVAPEGINATVAGSAQGIAALLDWLRADARFAGLDARLTQADSAPFRRLKIKLKREIVSFGVDRIAPPQRSGVRVAPADWNALIAREDVLLLDTRNSYEVRLGSFVGATDPGTERFRDFPAYVATLDPARTPRVAMFCTGGIRCEKASAYLLEQGFSEVWQLDGGILRYLEEVPADASRWRGECFIFDTRVALTEGGEVGSHVQCHACRQPLSAADRASPHFVDGLACPYCHDRVSPAQRAAFEERHRQIALAAARHSTHLGARMAQHEEQADSGISA